MVKGKTIINICLVYKDLYLKDFKTIGEKYFGLNGTGDNFDRFKANYRI